MWRAVHVGIIFPHKLAKCEAALWGCRAAINSIASKLILRKTMSPQRNRVLLVAWTHCRCSRGDVVDSGLHMRARTSSSSWEPRAKDPHYCAGRRKRRRTQTYNRLFLYLFVFWVGWPQFITEEGLRFPGRRHCGGSENGLPMRAASLIVSRQFRQRHNCYLCPLLWSPQMSPLVPIPSRLLENAKMLNLMMEFLERLMLHTARSSFVPDNLQILASMAMTMIMPTRNFSVVIVSLVTLYLEPNSALAALSPP